MQHRSAVLELTGSSSSRTSVSPVVLLKLLVLDEEREMFGRLLLQSFSLANGLWRKRKVDKLSLEYTTVNPQNYFCVMWDMEETVKIYCCKQLFFLPPSPVFIGADLWWTWVGWCLWLYFLRQWAGLSGLLVTAEKKVYFNIYTQQEQIDPWCKTVSVQTASHWHWAELKKRLKIWTATCVFVCLKVCLCWSGDEGRGLSAAWPDSSEETFLVILEAGDHKWQQLRV